MRLLFLFTILLLTFNVSAQKNESRTVNQTVVDVVFLASDYMEGRYTGSASEARAADYIKDRFIELGLTAGAHNNSWYQSFTFTEKSPHSTEEGKEMKGKNVAGMINNNAPTTIVIGAHYDHLGYGESGARDANDKGIHNGADDNASGVASLLYLAEKIINDEKYKSHNYLFISFSGEEEGLQGSKAFTKDPSIDLSTIDYMINMDMVGRHEDDKPLLIYGVGTSPSWKPVLGSINIDGINEIKTTEDGIGPTDHTSFYLKDIPVLHFFTGQHDDYHKSTDDSPLINFKGIDLISDYILAIIDGLDKEEKLTFNKTKTTEKKAPKYKVTLGVMPDYSSSAEGLQIDAVMDDRPADKAGILNGDLVIEMDGKIIKDIYGYMEILSAHEKGDTIIVKVKRDGEIHEMEVTF